MLQLGQTWEVAVWEIAKLGSLHLVIHNWEDGAWEKPLGRYLTLTKFSRHSHLHTYQHCCCYKSY